MKSLQLSAAAFALMAFTAGSVQAQAPANDLCTGAISLGTSFGQALNTVVSTGPYTNTGATTGADDPTTGYACFGEATGTPPTAAPSLENTVWFSFVGDGELYNIITTRCTPALSTADYIDFGDTQIAIYSGTCGSLTPVACNEDAPSATSGHYPAGLNLQTTAGTTYYMMIDGYLDGTTPSIGQFCIDIKKLPSIQCSNPTVSAGTTTVSTPLLCAGDTLTVTSTGVVAPTVGAASGVSWIISSASITGSTDPLNEPSRVATYTVSNPAPATSSRILINNAGLIGSTNVPYGTYYWTPVVFGNGTQTTAGTPFLSNHTLDPTCTFTGTSVAVNVVAPGDPLCINGVANAVKGGFFINSIYPVPVANVLNLEVGAEYNSNVTVSVKDMLGREVSSHNFNAEAGVENKYSISLNGESAGVYFVTVTNGRHIAVSKFVKE